MTTTKLHFSPADPLQEQPQVSQSMVQARDVLLDPTLFSLTPEQTTALPQPRPISASTLMLQLSDR